MFSANGLYREDLEYISEYSVGWRGLKGSTILVTGATGLIGTMLVDALMYSNAKNDLSITVLAAGRSRKKLVDHFRSYRDNALFLPVEVDITKQILLDQKTDFIVNLAGNTHPKLYATQPIGTIDSIVVGTKNILEFGMSHQAKRIINVSSVEVYGENRGDVEAFTEDYCGYIDCNTLRAGYPESKRLSEAMCQAYIIEKGLDIVSARLGRVYGPTVSESDTKSTSQFIRSAIKGEDIHLKSEGRQLYSYIYVADAVTALLVLLNKGEKGAAYNVSSDEVKSFRQTAEVLAAINSKAVKVEIPDTIERKGFSVVQKALMDSSRMKALGWSANYELKNGLERTVSILKGFTNRDA